MALTSAVAYYDISDPQTPGWAYRLRFDAFDEDGCLTDSHEESGEIGGDELAALERLVTSRGGKWRRPDYCDADGGSYRWTA